MDGLVCDGCGEPLLLADDVRYVVRVEGFAAYDPMEITQEDLARDFEVEMKELLAQLEKTSAREAQDQVHRTFSFDLCARCWTQYLRDPIRGLKRQGHGTAASGEPEE